MGEHPTSEPRRFTEVEIDPRYRGSLGEPEIARLQAEVKRLREALEHDYNARVAASLDAEQRLQRIVEAGDALADAADHCESDFRADLDAAVVAYREAVGGEDG